LASCALTFDYAFVFACALAWTLDYSKAAILAYIAACDETWEEAWLPICKKVSSSGPWELEGSSV